MLSELGGLFGGPSQEERAANQRNANDLLAYLAAGGAAPQARAAGVRQAANIGSSMTANVAANPALAARAGARAGGQAAVQGQMQAAGMEQAAKQAAMGESQRRVEMERARSSAALGGLLSTAGSVAGMALGGPLGGAAGGAAGGLVGNAINPNARTDTSNSPVWASQQPGQGGGGGGSGPNASAILQALAAEGRRNPPPVAGTRPPEGVQPEYSYGRSSAALTPNGVQIQPFDRPDDNLSPAALAELQRVGRPTGGGANPMSELERLLAGMGNPMQGAQGGFPASFILSDEESKTAIRDAAAAIDQFLGSMSPQSFEYRNPMDAGASQGRRTGVMAQDLERSEVGRQMVQEGPSGQRVIDSNAALSGLLAAQARLHDRLAALEEGRSGAPASQSRVRELSPEQFAAEDPPEAALLAADERRLAQSPPDVISGPAQPRPTTAPPAGGLRPAEVGPVLAQRRGMPTAQEGLSPNEASQVLQQRAPRPSVLDRFLESVEGAGSSVMGLFR